MNLTVLNQDWKDLLELLNKHEVKYLVVGAFALAFHGTPRYTGDIDLWIHRDPENARRLRGVLVDFGFGGLDITEADFMSRDRVVQLGYPPRRIDLITRVEGLSFEEAWEDRVNGELGGVPTQFISKVHFVQNKRAVGRPKDLADVDAIERLNFD